MRKQIFFSCPLWTGEFGFAHYQVSQATSICQLFTHSMQESIFYYSTYYTFSHLTNQPAACSSPLDLIPRGYHAPKIFPFLQRISSGRDET